MKVKSENEVSQSCPTLCDPMDAAYWAPLSMGVSRQEYWSEFSLPSPRDAFREQAKPCMHQDPGKGVVTSRRTDVEAEAPILWSPE